MISKRILIAVVALSALMVQSVFGQTYSYSDSWARQGFSLQQESRNGVLINHSLQEFYLTDVNTDGTTAKSVKVPGIFLPNSEGAPDLPGSGRYIAIPQGAKAILKVKAQRKEVMYNVEIAPAPAIPLDTDPSPLQFIKDEKIYSANQYYPLQPVSLSEPFKIRGVDAVMLNITPFQYNPVKKELVIYRDLVVEVSFQGGNGNFGEERLRSRWWDPILQSTLINAASLPDMDYAEHSNNSDAGEYEYVIITPDLTDYITWANTIKDFRTRQGISTGIVTTTELGGNTVSNIEAFVDNAYYNWAEPPAAVLLLGDYSTGSDGITSPFYAHVSNYPDFASDNGFADVDGDDLPDIIFARMTARNATELETMVTKFIDYETNPPADFNYYDQPITALGWQTERWFQLCSEVVGGYFRNVQGKNPNRINTVFAGNPASDPWSTAYNTSTVINYFGPNGLGYIPATPQELGGFTGGTATDVVNAINTGSFMLQHRDHGYYGGWGEPAFNTTHISYLTNVNNELPYVFSINCQTGAFHRSTECFAEKFHRYTYNGQNSGALGLIAATEVSYSFVNDTYLWGMFDNMFPDFMPNEGTQFPVSFVMPGFGNAAGKYYLQQSTWVSSSVKQITYRLFHHHGDAYLNLYTEVPTALSVAHASSILDNETSLQVTADDGSFIAITANGQILGTADGTGSAVNIPITPQAAGTVIYVTVTKQNYYRYEGIIDVTGGGGVLADFIVSNQSICAGETVTFTDQSTGDITAWNWDFGDFASPSSYSGSGPVDVTYNTDGIYDVSLTVTDGTNNDTETKSGYITVNALLANFTVSSTTIPVGGSVTFNNLSTCATGYNWQFPGGDPVSSTDFNPGAVTYNNSGPYDITLEVNNGISTDSKTVTINVVDISYCSSYGDPALEWIESIDIGGQINSSGQSSTGYEDFSYITFNLDPGSSNAIILTPGFASKATFEYWNVWIDFNMDGDFEDSGEQVVSATKKRNAVNELLNIPSTATGTTLMRISMKEGALPGSCETAFPGEVEDYTVSFAPPVPQPPVAGFTADNTSIAIGGTVNFTDQSQNNPTSWSWSFPGGSPATSTLQNPSVTYAGAGTFDVTLTVTNDQGTDALTRTDYVEVSNNPTPSYCIPVADNSADYIVSVQIGGTTSNSGQGSAGGYDYYSTTPFSLTPGDSYNVTLIPFNDKNRNFWRIWVDFNNDGDFEDADETLLVANNKKGAYSAVITIPAGVEVVSPDRLRVTMKTGGAPSSCETGFPGEVEDYDVNYGADFYVPVVENELALQVYPNPAHNVVNILVNGNVGDVVAGIFNATGKLMSTFHLTGQMKQLQLDRFGKGLYFIHVNDGKNSILRKFIVN